jgi:hypothetical protein
MSETIAFCFPYKSVGGVSMLFLRMAEYLAEMGVGPVAVIDYADGFMARHLRSPKVQLWVYPENGELKVPSDVVLVFQAMTPWSIFPNLRISPETRVFFWQCHPFNFVPTIPFFSRWVFGNNKLGGLVLKLAFRRYLRQSRRFVETLLTNRALVFMDGPNLDTTQRYLGISVDKAEFCAIPIVPSQVPQNREVKPVASQDVSLKNIRAVWIGRIVDFKVNILDYIIQRLNRYSSETKTPISLTIVGTGADLPRIQAQLGNTDFFSVEQTDHVRPEDLDTFLQERTDILFSMGTSALEGARLGIPTVLLDVWYQPIHHGCQLRFLFESSRLSIGDVRGPSDDRLDLDNFDALMARFLADPVGIGDRCRSYCETHHSIERVGKSLLEGLGKTTAKYSSLVATGCLEVGCLYRIHSALKRFVRFYS